MSLDPSEYFKSLPKRRVGAGALLLDISGNVLMVEPEGEDPCEEGSTVGLTNGVRAT